MENIDERVLAVIRRSTGGWISGRTVALACGISTRDVRDSVHRLVVDRGEPIISRSGLDGGYKHTRDRTEITACRNQLRALARSTDEKVEALDRILDPKTNEQQMRLPI